MSSLASAVSSEVRFVIEDGGSPGLIPGSDQKVGAALPAPDAGGSACLEPSGHALRASAVAGGWTGIGMTAKAGNDFDQHVLREAEARIVLPPGSRMLLLDNAEVSRDPLLQ